MSRPTKFNEITNNESLSWLTGNAAYIDERKGVLAICKVNWVHAVILFEYLKRSEQTQEIERRIKQIDFGPAHLAYCVNGKGLANVEEFVGEEHISQKIKRPLVGRYWFCETGKAVSTIDKIKANTKMDATIYSFSGCDLSSNTNREVKNCLTYAADVLKEYSNDLNIKDWDPNQIYTLLPLPNLFVRLWYRPQSQNEPDREQSNATHLLNSN